MFSSLSVPTACRPLLNQGPRPPDLKVVRKDLAEIGDRVSTLEENASSRDEELEILQQEVIHLKGHHVDLQAHAEDHENSSRRNDVTYDAHPRLQRETTLAPMSKRSLFTS
ncbi:hypothetical protein NDU88_002773 [Pleurodeles waltl]|uniref:Uncharacterized protein n=1 Tax=Pleurodeles waltl TaxID=8319 RepID=A0AAV7MNM2_PLEWA|nr:hypothetical protein NDU88_002773 [Pleurodeles waltl]